MLPDTKIDAQHVENQLKKYNENDLAIVKVEADEESTDKGKTSLKNEINSKNHTVEKVKQFPANEKVRNLKIKARVRDAGRSKRSHEPNKLHKTKRERGQRIRKRDYEINEDGKYNIKTVSKKARRKQKESN